MATFQQSIQKNKKEKGNNGYVPCCRSSKTCSISGSTRFSYEKFRELQSEYNLVNDHTMEVLGWSIQDRKRSFIMHVILNVDNI